MLGPPSLQFRRRPSDLGYNFEAHQAAHAFDGAGVVAVEDDAVEAGLEVLEPLFGVGDAGADLAAETRSLSPYPVTKAVETSRRRGPAKRATVMVSSQGISTCITAPSWVSRWSRTM